MKTLPLLAVLTCLIAGSSLTVSAQGTISVQQISTSATRYIDDQGLFDTGSFLFNFRVTATGGNVYLGSPVTQSLTPVGAGFSWSLNPGTTGSSFLSAAGVSYSSAPLQGLYVIRDGETQDFQVLVNLIPQYTGIYGVSLGSFHWGTTAGDLTPDNVYQFPGGFNSDNIFLSASPVPEPGTLALGLLGLGAIALFGRRSRRD